MKKSKVYIIGAGPGKYDLITRRGLDILKEADLVIYDYLVDSSLLEMAGARAELISCGTLGKRRDSKDTHSAQEGINNLLIAGAKNGKRVVRLKSGDPVIFSRVSEEIQALIRNKIKFEIVPGVTAGNAAASFGGIPLTDRKYASSCVFVTGHESAGKRKRAIDWRAISKCGTLVFYMAVGNVGNIARRLREAGKAKNTPVMLVRQATLPTQKVLTGNLGNIAAAARAAKITPPAIVIVGDVARLEKKFNWLGKGKKILFTGLSKEKYFEDNFYWHLPLIKIKPMESYAEFDSLLKKIREFDWVVFASRYGAEYFFERLKAIGLDSRALSGCGIAAVGNSTKGRLSDFGILADLVPKKESSEGLIEEFKRIDVKNKKIFLPRSDISDKGLERALRGLGAEVTTGFAYKNVMPKKLPDLDLNFFDEIMFTSPSTVRNFKKRYGSVPKNVKVECIGDVTLKEAKKWKLLD